MSPCDIITYDGPLTYADGLEIQRRMVRERIEGSRPDTLLLLEHAPTITVGRRSDPDELLTPADVLGARGIAVEHVDRGGQITYHAPGQIVGYPIFDLNGHSRDVHRYLRSLEEALILTLAEVGVAAGRRDGATGVWVGDAKIAAIGVKVTRWVTFHGFALNVTIDLAPFRNDFVPCGITDLGVTSLAELMPGRVPALDAVRGLLVESICRVFTLYIRQTTEK
jgi:lipoyl(octanoyl) transferase